MKIVREMLSSDRMYKSVIIVRDDGLYEVDWHYWIAGGFWQSTSTSSLPHHLTDTFENAIKIGEEQLLTMPGKELDGMTVNERLAVKGLDDEFIEAINARDKQKAIAILVTLRLTEEQATHTIEAIFNNPKYYGYRKK